MFGKLTKYVQCNFLSCAGGYTIDSVSDENNTGVQSFIVKRGAVYVSVKFNTILRPEYNSTRVGAIQS